jgi:urea transporter
MCFSLLLDSVVLAISLRGFFCATWLGYLRLPFSITWWLVLLAAYAIQTRRAMAG